MFAPRSHGYCAEGGSTRHQILHRAVSRWIRLIATMNPCVFVVRWAWRPWGRAGSRSVFLVYGENGQNGTETKPNKLFYAAAHEPKRIWEVPNGQHIAGITTEPAAYERRIIGFFHEALLARGETP
jgi:fermentation-respiration switch protein FrsA (DUF1100 family)